MTQATGVTLLKGECCQGNCAIRYASTMAGSRISGLREKIREKEGKSSQKGRRAVRFRTARPFWLEALPRATNVRSHGTSVSWKLSRPPSSRLHKRGPGLSAALRRWYEIQAEASMRSPQLESSSLREPADRQRQLAFLPIQLVSSGFWTSILLGRFLKRYRIYYLRLQPRERRCQKS